MENIVEKYETALNVLRAMLTKAKLHEGVKTTDYLLNELKAHKRLCELNIKAYLSPPAQEAELWKGVIEYIIHHIVENGDNDISYLQRDYSLSRRSEQPEAIAFAEWINNNTADRTAADRYYYTEGNREALTIPELYQLFKQSR
jgi:hypothetical protein